jgi:hypothetical protein
VFSQITRQYSCFPTSRYSIVIPIDTRAKKGSSELAIVWNLFGFHPAHACNEQTPERGSDDQPLSLFHTDSPLLVELYCYD